MTDEVVEIRFKDLVSGGLSEIENRCNTAKVGALTDGKLLMVVLDESDVRVPPMIATPSDVRISIMPILIADVAVIRKKDGTQFALKNRAKYKL